MLYDECVKGCLVHWQYDDDTEYFEKLPLKDVGMTLDSTKKFALLQIHGYEPTVKDKRIIYFSLTYTDDPYMDVDGQVGSLGASFLKFRLVGGHARVENGSFIYITPYLDDLLATPNIPLRPLTPEQLSRMNSHDGDFEKVFQLFLPLNNTMQQVYITWDRDLLQPFTMKRLVWNHLLQKGSLRELECSLDSYYLKPLVLNAYESKSYDKLAEFLTQS